MVCGYTVPSRRSSLRPRRRMRAQERAVALVGERGGAQRSPPERRACVAAGRCGRGAARGRRDRARHLRLARRREVRPDQMCDRAGERLRLDPLPPGRAGVLDPDAADHDGAAANRDREQRARADRAQIAPGEPGGPGILRGVGHGDLLAALEGSEQLRTLGARGCRCRRCGRCSPGRSSPGR